MIPEARVAPILIAGIGNILLQDDGFGPQAIARLESEYQFDERVELLDLGTPALDFVDYLAGREVVILLDALSCGGEPGEVLSFDHEALRRRIPGMRLSAHQPCLDETLFAAETAGLHFKDVVLIGVVGAGFDVTTTLTDTVSEATTYALEKVCEILARHGVQAQRRPQALPVRAWWNADSALPIQ